MPNLGALLKQEIARVSRRQIRAEIESLKSASTQHRKTIQGLRAQITTLEREVAALKKRGTAPTKADAAPSNAPAVRFIAKGLKTHRARLGLSAGDFGRLVGVTAQSVYNWEQQTSRPRAEQVARIASLRKMGKREVMRILEQMASAQEGETPAPKRRGH
jgi:DNA-binding transcriptional regulator YiaG